MNADEREAVRSTLVLVDAIAANIKREAGKIIKFVDSRQVINKTTQVEINTRLAKIEKWCNDIEHRKKPLIDLLDKQAGL